MATWERSLKLCFYWFQAANNVQECGCFALFSHLFHNLFSIAKFFPLNLQNYWPKHAFSFKKTGTAMKMLTRGGGRVVTPVGLSSWQLNSKYLRRTLRIFGNMGKERIREQIAPTGCPSESSSCKSRQSEIVFSDWTVPRDTHWDFSFRIFYHPVLHLEYDQNGQKECFQVQSIFFLLSISSVSLGKPWQEKKLMNIKKQPLPGIHGSKINFL